MAESFIYFFIGFGGVLLLVFVVGFGFIFGYEMADLIFTWWDKWTYSRHIARLDRQEKKNRRK